MNGLDTLRAAAITLVFLFHYRVFVGHRPDLGAASVVGWVGVDLFFVLSGYLIANQIFSGIARGRKLSLAAFYVRRALRTLPAFWFVLALYFIVPAIMEGHDPPPLWRFLTFTQNFGLQTGTAFSHAWSLCIEEQFYLVLPLIVVAGAWIRGSRAQGWALLIALLLLGITARAVLWFSYGRVSDGQIGGYHPYIYYATLCRFDEFLPGVAVAMLKNFHRPLWDRVTRRGQPVLAAAPSPRRPCCISSIASTRPAAYGYGFFMTAFGYSLMAMAFAVLVVAALSPGILAPSRSYTGRLFPRALVLFDLPHAQGSRRNRDPASRAAGSAARGHLRDRHGGLHRRRRLALSICRSAVHGPSRAPLPDELSRGTAAASRACRRRDRAVVAGRHSSCHQRRSATRDQIASTRPKGQAPWRKP